MLIFFRLLGNLAVRTAPICRAVARWMPNPMRFLGWKAFERQLLIFKMPAGSVALANDLVVAETVLADRDGNFPKSAHLEAMLQPLIGRGVFGQPGGETVRSRRKTYLKVLAKISDVDVEVVARSLTRKYMAAWECAGGCVPVPREISRLTIDIVTTMVFNDCFSEAESLRFVDLFFEYHKRCNPSVLFCTEGDEKSTSHFLEAVGLEKIGDEMREMMRWRFVKPLFDSKSEKPIPSFVAALIEEVGDLPHDELAALLLDEVSVMILAGHETSASVLSWLLWEIAGDSSLIAGIRATAPGIPEHEKYLGALVQEGLRLYPPIAFYFRDVRTSTKFRGKDLAAGSSIVISPWTIHRHKGIWKSATQFCPARWFNNVEKAEYSKLRFQPFGYGARFCPGKYFAEAELRAILDELIANFDVIRVGGRTPVPLGKLTSRPDYDFCLHFLRRVDGGGVH